MKSNGEWIPVVAMVGNYFAMGLSNVLVRKTLGGGIDHMIVATYRLVISTIFLAPIAYFWERKSRPKLTTYILCQLFFSALIGASLAQYFFLLGLSYTSVTVACALVSMIPATTFILALAFRLEKVKMKSIAGKAKVFGTVVCLGGALFLSFYEGIPLSNIHSSQAKADHHSYLTKKKSKLAIGCTMIMIANICLSSWMLFQTRISRIYPCQFSSTVILSFFGTFQAALLSLIKQRNVAAWVLTKKFDIITLLYAGTVGQGLCTVILSWCIKQKGPVFTSAFSPLTLIFASILDFFVLHGTIYIGSVLGSIIIIIGLYIFLWGKSKDTEECAIKQIQVVAEPDEYYNTASQVIPVTINSTCGK